VKEFVRVRDVCGVRKMSAAGNCCLVMCGIDLGAAQLIHQRSLFSYLALGKILLYIYLSLAPYIRSRRAKVFAGIYK
jgi:hypothetical protein